MSNILARKALERMLFWKTHKTKQALLVTGARQVGKTFLIREFLSREYESYVEFNLMDDDAARTSFAAAESADDLLLRISIAAPSRLEPTTTALFIDEVQACPSIMRHIKKIIDAQRFDLVLSGSLLGVGLEGVDAFPGGYVTELEMFPLDFEEFCWAFGTQEETWNIARHAFETSTPLPDFVHTKLLSLFRRYLLVGGMPDAVCAFVRDGTIDQVRVIQKEIAKLYKRDISQYAPKEQRLVVQNIFDLIPSELTGTSKRFRFSSIDNVKRFNQITNAFLWLVRAGVGIAAFNASNPVPPLLLSKQDNQFKLFHTDVGILTSTIAKRDTLGLLDGARSANLGGVYENAIAQELVAHGHTPYFHMSKAHGEIDFVIEREERGTAALLEIKSGASYRRHAALDNVLAKHADDPVEAFVLAECNLSTDAQTTYLPIYLAGLL